MKLKLMITLAIIGSSTVLSGCIPLAIGAGAAVGADKIAENKNGGDGLF